MLFQSNLAETKFHIYNFLIQDLKTDKDEEHCRKINDVLNNPPTPGSQRSGGANAEGDLQNLLNNMSQQQLIQLFGGVGQIGGLGNLLGTMSRPQGIQSTRTSTTTSSTPSATTNVTRSPHSLTPGSNTDSKSSRESNFIQLNKIMYVCTFSLDDVLNYNNINCQRKQQLRPRRPQQRQQQAQTTEYSLVICKIFCRKFQHLIEQNQLYR